jgi:hypothetical protein
VSELIPIIPSSPVPRVTKIGREQGQRNNADKQRQQTNVDSSTVEPPQQNDKPVHHIDEIV